MGHSKTKQTILFALHRGATCLEQIFFVVAISGRVDVQRCRCFTKIMSASLLIAILLYCIFRDDCMMYHMNFDFR